MSSTRPHAKGPEAKTRSLSDAHDVTTALLVSLFLCGVCIVCLQSVCSVLFSFLTGSLGLNVLIVKIRFEFVFNCCEKRISAFDSRWTVENKVRSATADECVGVEGLIS